MVKKLFGYLVIFQMVKKLFGYLVIFQIFGLGDVWGFWSFRFYILYII